MKMWCEPDDDGDPARAGGASVTGLTPGVAYAFAVTAVATAANGGVATGSPSAATLTAAAPAVPLTATAPAVVDEGSPATVTFSAPAADGSALPIVSWHVTPGAHLSSPEVPYTPGTTAAADPYPLADGAAESFAVTATDAAGHTFTLPSETTMVRPLPPASVAVTAAGTRSVRLSWTSFSGAAIGYDVLRADGAGIAFARVGWVQADGSTTGTYTDDTIAAGTTYMYAVAATGASDAAISAPTALAGPTTTPTDALGLSVDADPSRLNNVNVTWTYVGLDVSAYELEVADVTAGENFHTIDTPGAAPLLNGERMFGLTWGDTYRYRVRADFPDGTVSNYSPVVSYTPPLLPAPTLTAEVIGQTVRLSWGNLPPEAGPVIIEVRGDAYVAPDQWRHVPSGTDFGWQAVSPPATPLAYDDQGHPLYNPLDVIPAEMSGIAKDPGVLAFHAGHYEYRIHSSSGTGQQTAWSVVAAAALPDAAALPPTVVATTDTTVTVSWTDFAPAWYREASQLAMEQDNSPRTEGGNGYPPIVNLFDTPANEGFGSADGSGGSDAYQFKRITVRNLTPGTQYDFSWAGSLFGSLQRDASGQLVNGQPTTTWSFASFEATTTGTAPRTAPERPAAIAAVRDPKDANLADVHWINTPANEDGFVLQQSVNGGRTWTTVANLGADQTSTQVDISSLDPGTVSFQVMSASPNSTPTGMASIEIDLVVLVTGHSQGKSGVATTGAGVQTIGGMLLAKDGGFAKDEVVVLPSDSMVGNNRTSGDGSQAAARGALSNIEAVVVGYMQKAKANNQVLHLAMIGYSLGGGAVHDALADLFDPGSSYRNDMNARVSVDATVYIDGVSFNRGNFVWAQIGANLTMGQATTPERRYPSPSKKHFNYFQSEPNTVDELLKGNKFPSKQQIADAADAAPHGDFVQGAAVNDDLDVPGAMSSWPFRKTYKRKVPSGENQYDHITIDKDDTLHHKVVYDLEGVFARKQPITI